MDSSVEYDSWMTLCEHVLDVATEQAQKKVHETLVDAIGKLADEIIETTEEIDDA